MEKETSTALHMAVNMIVWGAVLLILVNSVSIVKAAGNINRKEIDQIEVNKEIREWYRYDAKYITVQDAATKILQTRGNVNVTFEFESINKADGAVINNTILTWSKDDIFTNPDKFNSQNIMKNINDSIQGVIAGRDSADPRVYSELTKDANGTIVELTFKYTVELAP